MPGIKKQRRMETDAKILEGAYQEFGMHGYAGAKLSNIAKRAGISSGLIIQNFGSKANLYVRLVEGRAERLANLIMEIQGDLYSILNFIIDLKRNTLETENGYASSKFMEAAVNGTDAPPEVLDRSMRYLKMCPIYHLMEEEQAKGTIKSGDIGQLYSLFWITMNHVMLKCHEYGIEPPDNKWFIDIIR